MNVKTRPINPLIAALIFAPFSHVIPLAHLNQLPRRPGRDPLAHGDLLGHRDHPPRRVPTLLLQPHQLLPDPRQLSHALGQGLELYAGLLVLPEDVAEAHHGVLVLEGGWAGEEGGGEGEVARERVGALEERREEGEFEGPGRVRI